MTVAAKLPFSGVNLMLKWLNSKILIGGEIMPFKPLPRPEVVQPSDQSIRYIPLTQGKVAIVDAADYEWLSRFTWCATRNSKAFYAVRRKSDGSGCIWMHRAIANPPDTHDVDHQDGNGLNNRRSNLRIATRAENLRNSRRRSSNTSGYKGVSWSAAANKWMARITVDGKNIYLGVFVDIEDAKKVYNDAALNFHKDFALVNQ